MPVSRLTLATKKKQNEFLSRIITCDATWVHHYTPESKRSSTQWKHVSSPSPRTRLTKPQEIQRSAVAGKVMACVFWDAQGVVLVDFVPPGHTVNASYYCTLLSDRLRQAVRRKRPGLLKKGVIFQHDNAPPHRARQTMEKIEEMGWELLQHLPYSPDLAPSDFHLFGPLKESLGGIKFDNNEECSAARPTVSTCSRQRLLCCRFQQTCRTMGTLY